MGRSRGLTALAVALTVVVGAAACTDDDEGGGPAATATPTEGKVSGPKDQLTVVAAGPVDAWDPQRITSRQTAGFASRTWMRTLTAYEPATDLGGQRKLTGDLARSTGLPNEDASAWTFTLRKGVTWEDGSAITCQDVRYGVARSFDAKIGSSGYALSYLDIPKKPDGTSTYRGPLAAGGTSAKSKQLLRDAVECKDARTVVFHLAEPVGNFDEVVSLPEFAPYKRSREGKGGADAVHDAFSSGPYRLEDGWTPSSGGTWVRNREWDRSSDPLRRVGPARILHKEGVEPKDALETIVEGDDGGRTLMLDPLPSALAPALDEAGESAQSVDVDGQLVDYLAVSATSEPLKKRAVRQALATATDREAYTQERGAATGVPTWSLLGTALPSTHETVLDHGPAGDADRARQMLRKAKVRVPVKITVAHRGDDLDGAMKRLEGRWEDAGFDVTLKPLGGDYFTKISEREVAREHDVVWANWGPDFPSAGTVLPPLFDDRINLSKTSVGRDYGAFADKAVTRAMDKAARTRDRSDRADAWARIDTELLRDGAYIPLRQSRLTYAAGSEVTGLIGNPVYGGVPEIGVVGVSG